MKTMISKSLIVIACVAFSTASEAISASYGWEDGGLILGKSGNLDVFNVGAPNPVHTGMRSLKLVDMSSTGPSTPQAYVAWVTGLQDGDLVEAGFWRYDTTPDTPPATRIWGHYTSDPFDIGSHHGSAGGNSDYGLGEGWDFTANIWTFDADGGNHDGLVIEARTYRIDGDTVWIDDLYVMVPDHAKIHLVPEPISIALIGVGLLALMRKK